MSQIWTRCVGEGVCESKGAGRHGGGSGLRMSILCSFLLDWRKSLGYFVCCLALLLPIHLARHSTYAISRIFFTTGIPVLSLSRAQSTRPSAQKGDRSNGWKLLTSESRSGKEDLILRLFDGRCVFKVSTKNGDERGRKRKYYVCIYECMERDKDSGDAELYKRSYNPSMTPQDCFVSRFRDQGWSNLRFDGLRESGVIRRFEVTPRVTHPHTSPPPPPSWYIRSIYE